MAGKKKRQKQHYKKPSNDELIELFYEHNGCIASVAKALGIHRNTVYTWIGEFPELEQHREQAKKQAIDFVKSKLFERIEGVEIVAPDGKRVYKEPPNITAIIFYLKTQAGWSEKQEDNDKSTETTLKGLARIIQMASDDYPDV